MSCSPGRLRGVNGARSKALRRESCETSALMLGRSHQRISAKQISRLPGSGASDSLRREAPSQKVDDDKHDVCREDAERNDRKYPTACHSRLAPASRRIESSPSIHRTPDREGIGLVHSGRSLHPAAATPSALIQQSRPAIHYKRAPDRKGPVQGKLGLYPAIGRRGRAAQLEFKGRSVALEPERNREVAGEIHPSHRSKVVETDQARSITRSDDGWGFRRAGCKR